MVNEVRNFVSLVALAAFPAFAATVTVVERTAAGAATNELSRVYAKTDEAYTTVSAPKIAGWRFMYWRLEPEKSTFVNRDDWGRAFDEVTLLPVDEVVTLTAVYGVAGLDADGDGVPDADEIYWYGHLDETAESDTDGDGLGFLTELTLGTNPHFRNRLLAGIVRGDSEQEELTIDLYRIGMNWPGVVTGDGETLLYNPNNNAPYVMRCSPEGRLFATTTNYVKVGTVVMSRSFSPDNSVFAYWTVDGARQADAFGRALDSVSFAMPRALVECVAVCETDVDRREMLYWYGNTDAGMDSDTDGDGLTFAQELEMGTNPLFKNVIRTGIVRGDSEQEELTPDLFRVGLNWPGVVACDGEVLLYNPNSIAPYILRCEPEGTLFLTTTNYVKIGELVTTDAYSPNTSDFAYWTLNGVRQADAFGRAQDRLEFAMPNGGADCVAVCARGREARQSLYWYGDDRHTFDSDTDGDGLTFGQELAMGLNPLFRNQLTTGILTGDAEAEELTLELYRQKAALCGIAYGDGDLLETNLQPFEQLGGALVDGRREEMFKSDEEGTAGATFGERCAPAVVDFDADGLWDFIVAGGSAATGWKVYGFRNIGTRQLVNFTAGAERFRGLEAALAGMSRPVLCGGADADGAVTVWFTDNGGEIFAYGVTNGTVTATGLSGWPVWTAETGLGAFQPDGRTVVFADGARAVCDTFAPGAVSAALWRDGDATLLLVALADGRIAYYADEGTGNFALKHRIWGGSYIGFAEGLAIAPMDWEDDGDVDCFCGTAGGRLVCLRDPSVGRPTGLTATAGADHVLLEWDANRQSRVSGYNVYRSAFDGVNTNALDFAKLAATQLPAYRDFTAELLRIWAYRVTSLGRHYTAGNSEPKIVESAPSEIVFGTPGGVTLAVQDSRTYTERTVEINVLVNNSLRLSGRNLGVTVTYDPQWITPVADGGVTVSPLLKNPGAMTQDPSVPGEWKVRCASGTMLGGNGRLLSFTFQVPEYHGTNVWTTVGLKDAVVEANDGRAVTAKLVSGRLEIFDAKPPPPPPPPTEPPEEPDPPPVDPPVDPEPPDEPEPEIPRLAFSVAIASQETAFRYNETHTDYTMVASAEYADLTVSVTNTATNTAVTVGALVCLADEAVVRMVVPPHELPLTLAPGASRTLTAVVDVRRQRAVDTASVPVTFTGVEPGSAICPTNAAAVRISDSYADFARENDGWNVKDDGREYEVVPGSPGDVNGDGFMNYTDCHILWWMTQRKNFDAEYRPTALELRRADFDGDGAFTTRDYTQWLIRFKKGL